MASFHCTCEIGFGDTDASGWVHFPQVFQYVERAEHRLLRELGIIVFDRAHGGWPRVHVSCDYLQPLKNADLIRVELSLSRIGHSSLTWSFSIFKADESLAAKGEMKTVRVNSAGKSQAINDSERASLLPYFTPVS